ncbi:MAG: SUMF1/EgtB/PvdO family nonheme iron enzyme [Verrucomicrobiota bacterium]
MMRHWFFFAIALCFFPIPSVTEGAEKVALLIGNNRYEHGIPLQNAVNDAKAVAARLEAGGWDVTLLEDAGAREMRAGLGAISENGGAAKMVMVFFAGHGIESKGENYLLPVDAELESVYDLDAEAIGLAQVMKALGQSGIPLKTVVLDCCRNNPLPSRSWLRDRGNAGLAEVAKDELPSGSLLIFSAAAGKTAPDGQGENSPFTTAFSSALGEGGSLMKIVTTTTQTLQRDFFVRFDDSSRSLVALNSTVIVPVAGGSGGGSAESAEMAELRRRIAEMEASLAATETQSRTSPGDRVVPDMGDVDGQDVVPTVTKIEGEYGGGREMDGTQAGEVRSFGGIEMVWCPPTGEKGFLMGSPETEELRRNDEVQHLVILTKGFWLAKTECTQGQWESVMGSNPSYHEGSKNLPVENVNWDDVQKWLAAMNARQPLPGGWKWVLPTEAQWEYACRSGTETATAFGDSLSSLQANFAGDSPYGAAKAGPDLGKTVQVASYPGNRWGIHDMHGNVWEWCSDWQGGNYDQDGQRDPRGPARGSVRVYRGGGWLLSGEFCRSADRSGNIPGLQRYGGLGFRPALIAEF